MAVYKTDIEKELDKKIISMVKEATAEYAHGNLKFKGTTFGTFLSNKMLVINIIQRGLPYSFFEVIRHFTPFKTEDWLAFLDISSKTLIRYKEGEKAFKPSQSEKIIEMAEVTHSGLGVFGNMDKFRLWLNTPNFSLGKSKPIDLLKNSYGRELVLAELTYINHGILA